MVINFEDYFTSVLLTNSGLINTISTGAVGFTSNMTFDSSKIMDCAVCVIFNTQVMIQIPCRYNNYDTELSTGESGFDFWRRLRSFLPGTLIPYTKRPGHAFSQST
jgi:hypothetical protein